MFPFIRCLGVVTILGGAVVLAWYDQLKERDKQEADRMACDYARRLFEKSIRDLTADQARRVYLLSQRHDLN